MINEIEDDNKKSIIDITDNGELINYFDMTISKDDILQLIPYFSFFFKKLHHHNTKYPIKINHNQQFKELNNIIKKNKKLKLFFLNRKNLFVLYNIIYNNINLYNLYLVSKEENKNKKYRVLLKYIFAKSLVVLGIAFACIFMLSATSIGYFYIDEIFLRNNLFFEKVTNIFLCTHIFLAYISYLAPVIYNNFLKYAKSLLNPYLLKKKNKKTEKNFYNNKSIKRKLLDIFYYLCGISGIFVIANGGFIGLYRFTQYYHFKDFISYTIAFLGASTMFLIYFLFYINIMWENIDILHKNINYYKNNFNTYFKNPLKFSYLMNNIWYILNVIGSSIAFAGFKYLPTIIGFLTIDIYKNTLPSMCILPLSFFLFFSSAFLTFFTNGFSIWNDFKKKEEAHNLQKIIYKRSYFIFYNITQEYNVNNNFFFNKYFLALDKREVIRCIATVIKEEFNRKKKDLLHKYKNISYEEKKYHLSKIKMDLKYGIISCLKNFIYDINKLLNNNYFLYNAVHKNFKKNELESKKFFFKKIIEKLDNTEKNRIGNAIGIGMSIIMSIASGAGLITFFSYFLGFHCSTFLSTLYTLYALPIVPFTLLFSSIVFFCFTRALSYYTLERKYIIWGYNKIEKYLNDNNINIRNCLNYNHDMLLYRENKNFYKNLNHQIMFKKENFYFSKKNINNKKIEYFFTNK